MEQKKIERKILITNKLGLHARAASKFVGLTSKCDSKFIVKKGSKVVNGSSLLGLMTLSASKGTEIKVQCIGKNAERDLIKLINLVKNNFGEEKPLSENINKEIIYRGIGVSAGYAIGKRIIKQKSTLSHSRYNIPISPFILGDVHIHSAVTGTWYCFIRTTRAFCHRYIIQCFGYSFSCKISICCFDTLFI